MVQKKRVICTHAHDFLGQPEACMQGGSKICFLFSGCECCAAGEYDVVARPKRRVPAIGATHKVPEKRSGTEGEFIQWLAPAARPQKMRCPKKKSRWILILDVDEALRSADTVDVSPAVQA